MIASISVVLLAVCLVTAQGSKELAEKLEKAKAVTKETIAAIAGEWQIEKYPNFLKSCFMHKHSWEYLKWKYISKIVLSEMHQKPEQFVMSFTGSSVTAGHDSPFNKSTPVVAGEYMQKPFEALGIKLVSRNVALGNNPCMPYDVCVKYFTGNDADIVHWEQNYFCDNKPVMFEQFIRQASTISSKPIIVFSESATGHWNKDHCKKDPHTVTEQEQALLKSDSFHLVSELNKDEFHRAWGIVSHLTKEYHGIPIHTFQHHKHVDYACLGPYIPSWEEGAASWHPSIIAHRLRAAHHAYFWLLILQQAIEELLQHISHNRSLDGIAKDVQHHLDHNYKDITSYKTVHRSFLLDDMKCLTDYEPRSIRDVSLKSKILSGLVADNAEPAAPGWRFIIYEDLVDKHLVERSKVQGYQDFKYLVYANEGAGALSIQLNVQRDDGPVLICQTPGIWGSLPQGFAKLWEAGIELYITFDVADYSTFTFTPEKAVKQQFFHEQELLDICIQLKDGKDNTKATYPKGKHVLTIVPNKKPVILAWVLNA